MKWVGVVNICICYLSNIDQISVSIYVDFPQTVKLGYNDHGYKDIMAITNKFRTYFWSQTIDLLH